MDRKDILKIVSALKYKNMNILASFLNNAYSYVEESSQFGSMLNSMLSTFVICLPVEDFYAFKDLFNKNRNLIKEIILDIYPLKENSVEICDIRLEVLDENNSAKGEDIILKPRSKGMLKIFISYSSKYNKDVAGDLKKFFEEYADIECFVAHDDIMHGSEWEKTIIESLESVDFFMPIQTEHLSTSYWCQQEAGYAFSKGIRIIPLIPDVGGTDPVGFYARFQGFKIKTQDLRSSVKWWLIKEGIISEGNAGEIEKRMFLFSASGSFAEAGDNVKSLCEFESEFTNADILKIVDSTLLNDQILYSFAARPCLRRLFRKNASIIPKEKLEEFFKHE